MRDQETVQEFFLFFLSISSIMKITILKLCTITRLVYVLFPIPNKIAQINSMIISLCNGNLNKSNEGCTVFKVAMKQV